MSKPFAVRVQHLLPQRALCAFIYAVSRSKIRWFKSALIRWFAMQYRIDLSEAREPDLRAYSSFNAFFTRALRDGAREIDPRREAIVSPADGRLTQFAEITEDRIVQAKGFDYSLTELLGETSNIDALIGGLTATIYLAPHNYHRVHAPFAGELVSMRYIAGRRFSVNATTAGWIDRLYCRNERLVCWFESDLGRYAAVLVGALNVSSISTSATGEIPSGRNFDWRSSQPALVDRGEEFACFNLGSTVILALPPGARFIELLNAGQSVRVGECIALAGPGN